MIEQTPLPAQAPAKQGVAKLPGGASLFYWDTGGEGPTVIFSPVKASSASG